MSKIIDNNGQYKITLPKDIILDKGWKPGMKIRFVEDAHGNIILKPIESLEKKKK